MTIDKANSRMVTATTMSAALRSGFAESVSVGAGFAAGSSTTAILLVNSGSGLIEATRAWQPGYRRHLAGAQGMANAEVAFYTARSTIRDSVRARRSSIHSISST